MTKRIMALLLCGLMILSFAACGSKDAKTNAKEDQKQFLIVGGMSALSSGNDSNPVLVDLAEKAGVEIEWDLMSDSLGEKVGVLIGGNQLPDAFIAVSSNFSPKLPKVINDASNIANGNAIGTIDTAA